MPLGLLNENHEPTAFYGVERNFVETAIIPSTWREGGVQVVGNFDNGLTRAGRHHDRLRPEQVGRDLGRRRRVAARLDPPGTVARARRATSPCSARSTGAACRACCSAASLFTGGASQGQPAHRARASRCGTCMRAGRRGAGICPASTPRHDLQHRGAERAAGRQPDADPEVVRRLVRAGGLQALWTQRRLCARRRSCAGSVQHRA